MKSSNSHMMEEVAPPDCLTSNQYWFANIITNRLTENNEIQPISPNGLLIAEEASYYLIPSPTLRPHQRIQIYNQQYWWRLLSILQDTFPLVVRLFGHQAFNEDIAVPYLLKHPPHHWSLALLGERLPQWIEEDYQAADQTLIYNSAKLDWAFNASFIAPQKEPLNLTKDSTINQEQLLSTTIYLQPHIHLLNWDYDLFAFRDQFLKKEVDYWIEHDFPSLPKERNYHFVLYRSKTNLLHWKEISSAEYLLLERLQKGMSIEAACDFLEKQSWTVYEQACSNLQKWFQEWTVREWLTLG